MTREEAIQNLKESIENVPNELENKKGIQDSLQLMVWLENRRSISESYPEVCKNIDRLEEENMRLNVTHWAPLHLCDLKEDNYVKC